MKILEKLNSWFNKNFAWFFTNGRKQDEPDNIEKQYKGKFKVTVDVELTVAGQKKHFPWVQWITADTQAEAAELAYNTCRNALKRPVIHVVEVKTTLVKRETLPSSERTLMGDYKADAE